MKELLQQASNDGLSDTEKMEKIKNILKKMDEILDCQKKGIIPDLRGEEVIFVINMPLVMTRNSMI